MSGRGRGRGRGNGGHGAASNGAAAGAAGAGPGAGAVPGAAGAAGAAGAPAGAVPGAAPRAATLNAFFNRRFPRIYRKKNRSTEYQSVYGKVPELLFNPAASMDQKSGELKSLWLDMTRMELTRYNDIYRTNPRDPLLEAAAWALFYAYTHYHVAKYLHDKFLSYRPQIFAEGAVPESQNINIELGEEVKRNLTGGRDGELVKIVTAIQAFPARAAEFRLTEGNGLEPAQTIEDARQYVLTHDERDFFIDSGLPDIGDIGDEVRLEPRRILGLGPGSPALLALEHKRRPLVAVPVEGIEDVPFYPAVAAAYLFEKAKQAIFAAPGYLRQVNIRGPMGRLYERFRPAGGVGAPLALPAPAAASTAAESTSASAAAAPPAALVAPIPQQPLLSALPALPGFIGAPGAAPAAVAAAANIPAGPVTGSKRRRPNNGVNALNEGGPSAAKEARRENDNNNSNNEENQGGGRRRNSRKARRSRRNHRKSKRTRRH